MKLLVTPFTLSSIPILASKGADGFLIGTERFANRLTASFSEQELHEACERIHSLEKEIYIQLNLIVHNKDLAEVKRYMLFLQTLDVDGIVFSDISIYQIAKRLGIEHLLIYHPETLNTNYYDPMFWSNKGIKGLIIAKEITLEDITIIQQQSPIEIGIIGHGHLNMFHSRRPLIENFFKYNEDEYKGYIKNRNLRLVEEIRNETYPVFQDEHGTHIFRANPMESYKEIDVLQQHLDLFIIDGIFTDANYLLETVENYHTLRSNYSQTKAETISNQYKHNHDSGFLYKKTVYDKV